MKKQLDRFVLTSLVTQMTGGSVYAGEEKLPGGVTRPVLVKVRPTLAKSDAVGEKRFVDEVRVLAALAGQPHVVTFYGMGLTDGVPWIATEHAPATLASVLGNAPADPRIVSRLIEHVARGLAALHGLTPPILHNRLCPDSILVCAGDYFKLTDFGVAASAGVEPTLSVEIIRYAAPELLSKEFGKPGPATDLYALGHIAYEMALGGKLHRQQFPAVYADATKPTDASPARWQAWHHSAPTSVAPAHVVVKDFPPALGEVISKLVAKPLAARYTTAAEVLADLSASNVAPMQTVAPLIEAMPAAPPAPPGPMGFQRSAPPRPAFRPSPPPANPGAPPAPSAYSPAGNEKYYVRLRNQTKGPFDLSLLQQLARQGQILRLHQVSTDQQTWKPAASVEGLFG